MDIISTARYIRMSPRKLRLLTTGYHDMPVEEAQRRLAQTPYKSARIILSVLQTAVADAQNNFKKAKNSLAIHSIEILEGTRMKRYHPVARGSAHAYKRRLSHIKVILKEQKEK